MKQLSIIIILFSQLIIHSESLFLSLMDEGDYYRAVGAYKEMKFTNGIEDSALYMLDIAAIYALSDFTDISESMYKQASFQIRNKEQLQYASLINSYLLFKTAYYDNALMELKTFRQYDDTLIVSLEFLSEMTVKEDRIYFIPELLPDSVKSVLEKYLEISLKNPQTAITWSSILPGLGELYNNDYINAVRDFTVTSLFTALTAYALIKNRQNFSIDPISLSWDYVKSRDWILVYFLYSTFVTRFKNGSMINAQEAAIEYNESLFNQYLTGLFNYIDTLYKIRILDYLN